MSAALNWTLVFHIFGMVMWIGGLLFAAGFSGRTKPTDELAERTAAARAAQYAMRIMAHPGAAIMIVTGVIMVSLVPSFLHQGWLHAKLTLVVLLIIIDLVLNARIRQLPNREFNRNHARIYHSAFSLIFFLIVVLAVLRPF